jgi:hypothetical protein
MRVVLAIVLTLAAVSVPATQSVEAPASAGSGFYSLAADRSGRVYLSWVEPVTSGGHALRFSQLQGQHWTAPRTIATGANWFVNWGDHPSIAAAGDRLLAHWLVDNDVRKGAYGYGVRIAESRDEGRTWRQVFEAGRDNVEDYTGFVSFLPGQDAWSVAYLTPVKKPGSVVGHDHDAGHIMTLDWAEFGADGVLQSDTVVDPDACTCCNTGIAQTALGPVIVYRDHWPGEVRDISIVRQVDGHWTAPRPVFRDGWTINACPSNGPAIAANAKRVAVAWFTAAGDQPRVKVAFSDDAGEHFAAPVQVDGGNPSGWAQVVLLDGGSAIVSWLEATHDGKGEVRLRRVWSDGRVGEPVVVATAASGRSAGQPQMVRSGASLVVAWRRDNQVRTAIVPIPVR